MHQDNHSSMKAALKVVLEHIARPVWKTLLVFALLLSADGTFGAQEAGRIQSTPVQMDGMELFFETSKNEFQVNEPLSIRMVFRNTTTATILIPPWLGGSLAVSPHLKEISTRTDFTGGENVGGGGALPSQTPRPISVPAGEQRAIVFNFAYFGFVQGDKDYDTATAELFDMARTAGEVRPRPIPAGEYELSVEITVRDWYREAIANEEDSMLVWNADHLRTNSVRVKIR